jgi:hypothetical protein
VRLRLAEPYPDDWYRPVRYLRALQGGGGRLLVELPHSNEPADSGGEDRSSIQQDNPFKILRVLRSRRNWALGILIAAALLMMLLTPLLDALLDYQIQEARKHDDEVMFAMVDHLELNRNDVTRVKVWQQFFANGRVIYDVTTQQVFVLLNKERVAKTYDTQDDPFIRGGRHYCEVNETVVEKLSANIPKRLLSEYRHLLDKRILVGGIGTAFFRYNWLPLLGQPQYYEVASDVTGYYEDSKEIIYIGLQANLPPFDRNIPYFPRLASYAQQVLYIEKHSGQNSDMKWRKSSIGLTELGFETVHIPFGGVWCIFGSGLSLGTTG